MWRLSGELAVNCSTLVDLPRQTHGLRWMRDELIAPPDLRLTLNGADDDDSYVITFVHVFCVLNIHAVKMFMLNASLHSIVEPQLVMHQDYFN